MSEVNMYRAQQGKGDRPSAHMCRTRVAYLLLQVSVSEITGAA